MNEHEVTREMTFEEEYKILKEDMHKLLKTEVEDCEPPFANWVAFRAYRFIQKLLREIQQYRALGTVEECRKYTETAKAMLERNITPEMAWEYMKFEDECVRNGFSFKSLLEAREKQVVKEPELYGDCEDGKLLCPNCQYDLMDLLDCGFANCPYCGQALDWGREGISDK